MQKDKAAAQQVSAAGAMYRSKVDGTMHRSVVAGAMHKARQAAPGQQQIMLHCLNPKEKINSVTTR
jgi:hypothetical protein